MDNEKQEQKEAVMPEMVIKLTENGGVAVTCTFLENKVLCWGMLTAAQMAVAAYVPNSKIVKPKGGIMNFARKRF